MQVVPDKTCSIIDQLESIEKMIPNPFIISDESGVIVYANQLALDLFRYTNQTLLAKKLSAIIPFEFPARSTESKSTRCLGLRENLEEVELEICYHTIKENLVNLRCISIFEITPPQDEKFSPSKPQKIIEDLRNELQNRTKELEVFSYAVSHDLQAPLRGVDGFTNIFINKYFDQLDDQGKHLLAKVTENVNKVQLQLLQLDYLLQLGAVELRLSEIDMHALTTTVLESMQLSHLIRVTINRETWITGDVTLIRDVLEKLISNAVKFSFGFKHPKIEIGCLKQGLDNHFFVKDCGIGFEEAFTEVVFDVFQQLHDPFKYPGIGLSLATVKQIISRHGGHVWATGKENKGATFYFSLNSNIQRNGLS